MKKSIKKMATLGMALALTVTSLNWGQYANAAGLPTTDGHKEYVNSKVFDVIGSDTFGTKELDAPLFDMTQGSQNITKLQVPTLAYDDTSVGLVWMKPEKYDNVADYNVYINGKLAGTARGNYEKNNAWADTYMKAFYEYYKTNSDVEMVDVDIHCYRATDLTPDTEYTFKVVAVDADGKELGTPQTVTQKTTKAPETLNIVDYGAVATEGYTSYNDEVNAIVEKNTKAIQAAIDACPDGGKVVVPEAADGKVFVCGAVWLKSNMTLEVNGTLWASPNSDHFEIGFLMYPFYTDTRGWGLVNAMSADEKNPITNVRVTGTGTLYGNGWKYGKGNTVYEDGYTSNKGKNTLAGDPKDTATWGLPQYCGGSNSKVFYQGVQAKDSAYKYLKNTGKYTEAQLQALLDCKTEADTKTATKGMDTADLKNAYATRSSLLIMRNCENVYVGDITIENPSNHSVNILDSRNIATTNVKVFSFDGNNGDGLGFGCSQNVICWGNFTDTGDDNLGFGSSVGMGARDCDIQTNSEVWMFDNFLREGHGGLAAGSHTGNGIQDVLFEDTVMNHIDMAFRFKSAPTNGGFGANITMRDCAVADTRQGWVLTTSYSDANSASTTEYAEIGEFYNFASYNISLYGLTSNTIQVLADVDPISNPQKPLHSHHNLYFQDITFGGVKASEALKGCENAVFYNVKTVSTTSSSVKTWNNMQYCKNIVFQGTTWDSVAAQTSKMKALMSGITVKDNTVKAEMYKEGTTTPDTPTVPDTPTTPDTPTVPDTPSNPSQGSTWTVSVDDCTDFFNDAVEATAGKTDAITTVPKLEVKNDPHNIGYIFDNEHNKGNTSYPGYEAGYAYPNCDIAGLEKLILPIHRQTSAGEQKVSVRLDSKDGKEIASAMLEGSKGDGYINYEMAVTLPEGVDTTAAHKLFVVFTSKGNTANYIANVQDLTGVKSETSASARESVDISGGLKAGVEVNTNSAYGTVASLEDTAIYVLSELGEEPTKVIDGVTYTQFIQANNAANAGGAIPADGTATYVFKPKKDCSVTLHSRETSKVWWFVESKDQANVSDSVTDSYVEPVMTFNLKAGNTYYYYCQGSKPMVYGIYFDESKGSDLYVKSEAAVAALSVAAVAETAETVSDSSVKLSWTAVENDTDVFYGVDTYVDGVKVDMVDGIKDTTTKMERLSSGVKYTFKVYVSEKGDTNTGHNKTLVGEVTFTTEGAKDTAAIKPSTDVTASAASAVYTHAQGTWTNISKQDDRVRGYKIYANGTLVKTLYNYQIAKYATVDNVSNQVGRLTPGIDNKIQIVAFTDAGVEYKYPETTIKTLGNYDYKAPVWANDAKLTAVKQGNDVVLTWTAATDDTKVGGYRVYVDGVQVGSDVYFNPVNGAKTTTDTTYTVTGLDLTKDHTFTVQAGDTWWKAEDTMGTFDKMAGFNWTVGGLSVTLNASSSGTDETKPGESETPTSTPTEPSTEAPTVSGDKMEVSGENKDSVKDVVISGDAKFEGNVNKADVKLVIEKLADAVAETVKSALKGALEAAGVAFDKADAKYYDISLKAGDSVVKLESGKVQITFAWESGKSADKNDVKVYHYNNDKLEEVAATITADGIRIVADSFSPYVVVYTEKAAQAPTEAPTQTPGTSAPSTGDTAPFALYASLCVMMLAAGVLVSKKRRA